MDCSFKGKKILITGAGRGMGRDLAIRLHKDGAVVYALSKTVENLKSLEKECPGIKTIECDLGSWSAIDTAVKDLEPLDYLVNNAGVSHGQSFLDFTEEVFDVAFNVNVKSYMLVSKLVAQKMIKAGKKGSIVNLSSVAGLKANPAHIVYDMTKAAVEMLTKGMAKQLGPHGIRVNSVAPTLVLTDMGKAMWEKKADEIRKSLPLQQLPTTGNCVDAILYLLSDLSRMTTGSCFPVDCGYLAV